MIHACRHKRLIDLTHTLHTTIPTWSGACGFQLINDIDYDEVGMGPALCVQSLTSFAGIGTHVDAPAHFFRKGRTIDHIDLNNFISEVYVIDIRAQVSDNNDYKLQTQDIIRYEQEFGTIAQHATVIVHTGWYKHWADAQAYRNEDTKGVMHFPGVTAQAAEELLKRDIVSLGIDTLSPDGGDTDFPVHQIILGADKMIFENLTNLEELPSHGAIIIALPQKIKDATESSIRVVGFISA